MPTAPNPTRVGLIGAGYIAEYHMQILRQTPGVQVAALLDTDQGRAQAFAASSGIPRVADNLAQMRELGVDIVHLLTPPDTHEALTREALELGMGALVEKPLALSSSAARQLGALAAERSLPLGSNHNNLMHPTFRRLLAHLQSGRIGRLEHVRAVLNVPIPQLDARKLSHWMFREARNIFFEQAIHPFSQIHALLGAIRRCTCTPLSSRDLGSGPPFHDRWVMAVEAERGSADFYLGFGRPFPRAGIELIGSDGSLEADLIGSRLSGERKTQSLEFWNTFLAGWGRVRMLGADSLRELLHYATFTLGIGPRQDPFFAGMRDSILAFHHALRTGTPLPVDATAAAEVIEWCEQAAAGLPESSPPHPRPAPRTIPTTPSTPPRPGEVAVLGATGFIGRRVVAHLLRAGRPVTAVVRGPHGLPAELEQGLHDNTLRLIRGSLDAPRPLAAALAGTDVVIDLANDGGATWPTLERTLIPGTVELAELCHQQGVRRFVYVSSIAALYLGPDAARGDLHDSVAVDSRPDLRADYARAKIEIERRLSDLHNRHALPLTIVRPGVVLGAGTPLQHEGLGQWVRDNHCVGWGLGAHPLPLVWVEDVAGALVRCAAHPGPELDGRALNLCARVPLSAREIVAELRRVSGRDLHFHARPLPLSQAIEIGKWLVKLTGRRRWVPFPSWRDFRSRACAPAFAADNARTLLDWRPLEDRDRFLRQAVHVLVDTADGPQGDGGRGR